jgi:hypothetical protein
MAKHRREKESRFFTILFSVISDNLYPSHCGYDTIIFFKAEIFFHLVQNISTKAVPYKN